MYVFMQRLKNFLHKVLVNPFIKASFRKHGKKVYVSRGCVFAGNKNIVLGDDVSFGPRCLVYCTRATITIGSHIIFGPNVTLITGDHRIDLKDKPMSMVKDNEKRPEDDLPIIIDDDVWVGANVTILKGVHIGTGSVVAAGAVVVKDVPPFSIVAGVPARVIKSR